MEVKTRMGLTMHVRSHRALWLFFHQVHTKSRQSLSLAALAGLRPQKNECAELFSCQFDGLQYTNNQGQNSSPWPLLVQAVSLLCLASELRLLQDSLRLFDGIG